MTAMVLLLSSSAEGTSAEGTSALGTSAGGTSLAGGTKGEGIDGDESNTCSFVLPPNSSFRTQFN